LNEGTKGGDFFKKGIEGRQEKGRLNPSSFKKSQLWRSAGGRS